MVIVMMVNDVSDLSRSVGTSNTAFLGAGVSVRLDV